MVATTFSMSYFSNCTDSSFKQSDCGEIKRKLYFPEIQVPWKAIDCRETSGLKKERGDGGGFVLDTKFARLSFSATQ
jgi:hypothetical protein